MDRELQRQVRKMTDEGLKGFDFNNQMKDHVRKRVAEGKQEKDYRRRWYAPLISFAIVLIVVFAFAVVKGEQWGILGSEKLSGFFTNKSNFDVEIRYEGGTTISTFTDTITNQEGEEKALTFTKEEMSEIYSKIESLNLKGNKQLTYREDCTILSLDHYKMKIRIRMNDDEYEYYHSDCGTTADRREFDELRKLIITIIKQKPGYEVILKQILTM
ncbi:hypothetical protein F0342_01890 [Bacillus sp. CH30_1T]|uniref:hypothetical protein n=1 Tax=Bacillus sp. CH30_1T TaxID=2604836 RepID=UPI0011ED41C4|nr:hypothetical protein [Bacillus sp. CH30_1T]KAA0566823.1 hypothetical protein F0342_01890 [Bacillus sp. CH30_1T]